MDTLLILLGVLGFGAIIIAIHVFSVGSDSYGYRFGRGRDVGVPSDTTERRNSDRRKGIDVAFPLFINGSLIQRDRRLNADRRSSGL